MADLQFVFLVLLVIGFGIAVLWQLTTTYFLTPLSQIPNAGVLAPISRLIWAFIQEHRGKITIILPKLHEQLGPLVRIGPNELSYYSLDIYKAINSPGSKWTKDPRVYGQFVQDSHPGLFSITSAIEHAQRRRLMGQIFNRSKMPLLEGMMLQQTTRFLEAVKKNRGFGFTAVDLVPACRALESDIISCFGFGAEIGGIAEWEQGGNLDMVAENDRLSQWIALHSNLPGLVSLWAFLKTKLYKLTGWRKQTDIIMESFDEWSSTQLVEIMYGKIAHTTTYPYFIETMIRSGLPAECALSEAKEMLGPGTDTTSATLAHIIWGLAHDQKYQRELYEDLAASGWPDDMTRLEAVPRLRAAVKEGIRWTGAAAAMLPRVAPLGGATLAGKYIPEGTILSSSPIWYLHDKDAFPSPHTYRPSRWLYESSNLRDEYYIPFSKGPNTCIGAHFAYLELYIALSQFIKTFHVRLPLEEGYTGEATLPPRLEWVAAVPLKSLEVHLTMRT